jgi:hypothetical protein
VQQSDAARVTAQPDDWAVIGGSHDDNRQSHGGRNRTQERSTIHLDSPF